MTKNSRKKIAIALSGGVDSAVAARILKDNGSELVGFFLKLWSDPLCQIKGENRCCDYEALEDARRVAGQLDIPFYVIDAKAEFKKEVVDYFIDEYRQVRTPNPCVVCNEKIKFNLLLKKALAIGCDSLATGHYARIVSEEPVGKSTYNSLHAGVDKSKDQSYMLYRLTQEQLSKITLPLGGMAKKEVRAKAAEWDLPVKEKAESQEICFFGDRDYRDFLRRYLPANYFASGDIVDSVGQVIGRHEGLISYTIGQRRAVSQSKKVKNVDTKKLYVIGFNLAENQLIVGEDNETYKTQMTVMDLYWINRPVSELTLSETVLTVKIRAQAEPERCRIKNLTGNKAEVLFETSQRAVTPGQSAVFYIGDEVIGGGVIS